MSDRQAKQRRRAARKAKMADLTPEQKLAVDAFAVLDKIIKQCTLPVEQGVALARAFGECARATDYLMGQAAEMTARPKLAAVPDPKPIDHDYDDAVKLAKDIAAEAK